MNLERLRQEMLEHLTGEGMVVFHSHPRSAESALAAVPWDTEGHPDFREFVAAARAAGVKMMTLFAREFNSELVEEALDGLGDADLDRDQRRAIESQLRELQAYEGFVCQVELSFDHGERVYVYDQRTEWYDELSELVDQIDEFLEDVPGADPLSGFYSNN